jgi:hypothetical protein
VADTPTSPRSDFLRSLGPGYFGVVGTGGVVPWLIRRGTRSAYNHAFITLGDSVIVQAMPGGVQMATIMQYDDCKNLAFSTGEDLTADQRTAIVTRARALTGDKYDFADIAEDALDDMHWHWRWLIRLAADTHELDCSQLVAVCGIAAGQDAWCCGKTPTAVTPGDLGRLPGVQPAPALLTRTLL